MKSSHSKNESVLLIVDDEAEIRELLTIILTGEVATTVLTACDGQEALEIIKKTDVDCVLSDFQMPKKNGMQLLEQVTGLGIYAPFVMLTAHTDQEKLANALRLGALDFISKPFTSAQVKGVVSRALEIGKRRREYQEKLDQICIEGTGSSEVQAQLEHERKMMRLLQIKNSNEAKPKS